VQKTTTIVMLYQQDSKVYAENRRTHHAKVVAWKCRLPNMAICREAPETVQGGRTITACGLFMKDRRQAMANFDLDIMKETMFASPLSITITSLLQ
jgi:hypothetical protein